MPEGKDQTGNLWLKGRGVEIFPGWVLSRAAQLAENESPGIFIALREGFGILGLYSLNHLAKKGSKSFRVGS